MKKRILAAFLSVLMMFAFIPTTAFAVTGNQIAADGTYNAKLQGCKEGKKDSSYTATLEVKVLGGKITSISMTNVNSKASKMTKAFNASGYQNFLNYDASVDKVNEIADTDAVTSATTSATANSSSKYSLNLIDALVSALNNAPDSGKTSTSGGDISASDEIRQAPLFGYKEGELKYTAILNVGIKDGKIQNLWLTEATSSKMSTGLTTSGYSEFLGLEATVAAVSSVSDLDAVSSATTGSYSTSKTTYSINLVDSLKIALSDGEVYTSAIKGQRYDTSKKKVKDSYTGTLNVKVDNGKIIGIWLTGVNDDKFLEKVLAKSGYGAFIGIDATSDAVNSTAATKAVTGATAKSYITNSYEYSMNFVEALLNIVSKVPTVEPEQYYKHSVSVDNNKYQLEVIVGLTGGKVTSVALGNYSSNGDWSTVLSKAQALLVGKSQSDAKNDSLDAVSSATKYTASFYSAVSNALGANIDLSKELAKAPEFVWSSDNSSAVANVTYKNGDTTTVEAVIEDEITVNPSCEKSGTKVYTATAYVQTKNGSEKYSDSKTVTIPATGHDWGEWTVTTPASYTQEGLETRMCKSDSSHFETRVIPKLIVEYTKVEAKAATCAEDGNIEYYEGSDGNLYKLEGTEYIEISQSDTVIHATGQHDWVIDEAIWTENIVNADVYTCAAKVHCTNCGCTTIADLVVGEPSNDNGTRTFTANGEGEFSKLTDTKVVAPQKYTITVVDGAIKDTDATTLTAVEGTVVTVEAVSEKDNQKFDGWYIDDVLQSESNVYSFALKKDITLTAKYVDNPTSASIATGDVSLTREIKTSEKDVLRLRATYSVSDRTTYAIKNVGFYIYIGDSDIPKNLHSKDLDSYTGSYSLNAAIAKDTIVVVVPYYSYYNWLENSEPIIVMDESKRIELVPVER